jgi:glycosyltransferase involved in cell wall biosynthesis
MKIAFIGIKGLPSQAGVDRVVEAIVRQIDQTTFEPVVYCSSAVVPADTVIPGVQLRRIHALPGKHLHALTLFLFAALHALFFGDYAVIHLHNVEAAFVLPLLRLRYKVISTSHGAAQTRDKWSAPAKALITLTEYPFIFLSNCITSVSDPLAEVYRQQFQKPVYYIPNGVDVEEVADTAAALQILHHHGIQPGNYILFAAGRIMGTKGCHFLLEAFRQIETDLQLVIVGDASFVPDYEQQLHELADDRVHFIPFIAEKATILGLLQQARLFVFPSTVEAMSMMLLEAASVGVPVVCSDIPENVKVMADKTLYFQSANVKDLRQKLQWALQNPTYLAQSAGQAQAWVAEQFSWHAIVRQYEQLYRTCAI